jgi:hypothetical protein
MTGSKRTSGIKRSSVNNAAVYDGSEAISLLGGGDKSYTTVQIDNLLKTKQDTKKGKTWMGRFIDAGHQVVAGAFQGWITVPFLLLAKKTSGGYMKDGKLDGATLHRDLKIAFIPLAAMEFYTLISKLSNNPFKSFKDAMNDHRFMDAVDNMADTIAVLTNAGGFIGALDASLAAYGAVPNDDPAPYCFTACFFASVVAQFMKGIANTVRIVDGGIKFAKATYNNDKKAAKRAVGQAVKASVNLVGNITKGGVMLGATVGLPKALLSKDKDTIALGSKILKGTGIAMAGDAFFNTALKGTILKLIPKDEVKENASPNAPRF